MATITSFAELTAHLSSLKSPKRLAVANALDAHTLAAVQQAVESGIIEAYLIGNGATIESELRKANQNFSPFVHVRDAPDAKKAATEAVGMLRAGEADILMKGLLNTDVLLRAILDKENGIVKPGTVLSFNAALEIPHYGKLLFFSDPVVIPTPSLEQRVAMIQYAITTAKKFGIAKPKVALIHATEVANPKIQYMQDYLDIVQMARKGVFGNSIVDGPLDVFLALDAERGSVKNVESPVLGNADVLIFPNFESANVFYKSLSLFAGAQMAGLLQGTDYPVVLTSRSETVESKFYSIAMACLMMQ